MMLAGGPMPIRLKAGNKLGPGKVVRTVDTSQKASTTRSPGSSRWIVSVVLTGLTLTQMAFGTGRAWAEKPRAQVVLDEREFHIKGRNRAILKVHRRVQINREAGNRLAQVAVYENAFSRCKNITGRILNANGDVVKELARSDIERVKLSPRHVLYSDAEFHAFDLGAMEYPYSIEYAYEVAHETLFFWPSWRPQEDIPVQRATYTLILPKDLNYTTRTVGPDIDPRTEVKRGNRVITWELTDIEARTDEPAMPPESKEQLALHFAPEVFSIAGHRGSFATWETFSDRYRSLTSGQYALPREARDEVLSRVSGTDDARRKVATLYAYLQEHTRYVAIELGIGGWQPYSAASTFKNRYGDCKDLSTLMVSMLAEVGVRAYPALALTRNRGVVATEFPSNQFNHCITFVPLDSDTLWLECTADQIAAGEIPASIEGCKVLVIKEDGGEIIQTPQSGPADNVWTGIVKGSISTTGILEFTGSVTATGEIATKLRWRLNARSPDDRKRWLKQTLDDYLPDLEILDWTVERLDRDLEEPLLLRFEGRDLAFGSRGGNRLFFNPTILNRNTRDLEAISEDRKYPVFHEFAYTTIDSVILTIPEAFRLEAAPSSEDTSNSFGAYRTDFTVSDGRLVHTRSFRLDRNWIPVSDHAEYASFLKRVARSDGASYVFKRRW